MIDGKRTCRDLDYCVKEGKPCDFESIFEEVCHFRQMARIRDGETSEGYY